MTVPQRIWIAIRFVIFCVGGFLLTMVSWANLESRFTAPRTDFMSPYPAAPLLLVGAFADAFRRWRMAPLGLPVGVCFYSDRYLFSGTAATIFCRRQNKGMLIFSLPVVISYVVVRGYYRRQSARALSDR
jgi:hypothetical protein